MMIGFNASPPASPTSEAITAALTLLAVASDPAATRARLDELVAQIGAVHAAIAEHDVARKAAEDAQEGLADLRALEQKLNEDRSALDQAQTQTAVASSALAAREQNLTAREAELAKREADTVAKEKALADRVASYRQALA